LPCHQSRVQQRFCVCPYGDDYEEPVNIWTLGAMVPGARKTHVQEELTKPLTNWEHEKAESMRSAINENETERTVTQRRIDKLQNDAAKESHASQRKAIIHEITVLKEAMRDEIRSPRLFTNDCTAEAFQTLLAQYGERMAVLSDEGGIFEVMAGLYNDGRVNMDVFLKSHAGSPVRVDRGGRAAYLNHPLSTFGLAVQPAIIEDLGQGHKRRFRGNGCLARFLYVVPPSNVGRRDVTRRHVVSEETRKAYHQGVEALLDIPPILVSGIEQPRVLRLDSEALKFWMAYQQTLEPRQGDGGDLQAIADWTAKLPGAALRLAGLSHIIENGDQSMTIGRETMERCLHLADLLIEHARAAFSMLGTDQALSDAKSVLRWIQAQQSERLTQNQIYKGCDGRIKKVDRLKKALEVLIDRNMISDPILMQRSGPGRPSVQFQVNPILVGATI
jgi:putative DNA primase/helicase